LLLAIAARAQLTNFTIIDYPDASGTLLEGINDAGDVVGSYFDSAKVRHAFLLRNGRFTSVEVPGSTSSAATDINAAGDIVGFYSDASNLDHGFLLSGGRLTPIDYPGFERTRAFTINARGEIVGMAWNTSGDTMRRGFLLSNGRFTEICYPEAAMTMAFGINDQGEIVGRWSDVAGKVRGFLWRAGNFTSFEFPGAQITASDLVRITNSGEIVGPYTDARGRAKGFLLRGGRFTSFDAPGSVRIVPRDITNLGQVVGVYADSRGSHGMITAVAPSSVRQPVLVDDDNAECPGSLPTIQEAVRVAPAGATILVCRGIYTGSVNITGPEKNGLKLIAMGRTHEVVLQGDYAARDGFHLENVSDVLIRGFTVRDFGTKATSATEWGAGNLIYLENAHRNTIEQNQLFNSDRTAIMLVNSSNNIVQQNVASADNNNLATCGIEVQGAQSANNLIQLNMTHGNKLGGIRVADAGPGNIVQNNTVLANGRYGIDVQNSSDVWVEGNRISYNRGFWGTTPGGQQPGLGINLANLIRATIFDNRARGNSGADLNWDGKGENRIESNACENCVPASACQK
jgi:parallel beta-helix repeat protein/probable HAF family extracellular repeat protein